MYLQEAWEPSFHPGYELEMKASTSNGEWNRESLRFLSHSGAASAANIDPPNPPPPPNQTHSYTPGYGVCSKRGGTTP